jgi:hypothetical protein
MKLADWLEAHSITDARFGEMIGAARQAVHRYRAGGRVPDKVMMSRIVKVTGGAVSPNDFYEVESSATPSERAAS